MTLGSKTHVHNICTAHIYCCCTYIAHAPTQHPHTQPYLSATELDTHARTYICTHTSTITHLDVARALSPLWMDLHGNRARLPRYPSPQQSRLRLPRPCAGHCQRRSGTKRRHRTEPPCRNHEKHARNPRAPHTARGRVRHRHLCHADGGLSRHCSSTAMGCAPQSQFVLYQMPCAVLVCRTMCHSFLGASWMLMVLPSRISGAPGLRCILFDPKKTMTFYTRQWYRRSWSLFDVATPAALRHPYTQPYTNNNCC